MRLCEHHRLSHTHEMSTDECVGCKIALLQSRVAQLEGEILTPIRDRVAVLLADWKGRKAVARFKGEEWRHARDMVDVLEELLALNPPGIVP